MCEININCQPSLTEDHLVQIHAALMSQDPGSKFSLNISNEDDMCVPRILSLMMESDWAGTAEPLTEGILIRAQRN